MNKSPRLPIAFVTLSILIGTSVWVYAAGPGDPTALIPYQGRLELDGAPLNGTVDLRVGLFTGAGADASCLTVTTLSACGQWSDELLDTPISEGRFAVRLGANTALPNGVLKTKGLHLGFAVGDGAGGWTLLSTLQPLLSVPHAVSASGCPSGTYPHGAWCIDNFTRYGNTTASETCGDLGMSVCPAAAMAYCRVRGNPPGSTGGGEGCGSRANGNSKIQVSDVAPGNAALCYVNGAITDCSGGGGSPTYFCCAPRP